MTRQDGFTMVELITVMVLLGVLAAIGLPRLMGDNGTSVAVFGDQLASALRQAHTNAVARRRTVCVEATGTAVRLRIKTTAGPGACNAAIDNVTDDLFASRDSKVTVAGAPATLFFQPDGTVSSSQNGPPLGRLALAIQASGVTQRSVVLEGSTGYVR